MTWRELTERSVLLPLQIEYCIGVPPLAFWGNFVYNDLEVPGR